VCLIPVCVCVGGGAQLLYYVADMNCHVPDHETSACYKSVTHHLSLKKIVRTVVFQDLCKFSPASLEPIRIIEDEVRLIQFTVS